MTVQSLSFALLTMLALAIAGCGGGGGGSSDPEPDPRTMIAGAVTAPPDAFAALSPARVLDRLADLFVAAVRADVTGNVPVADVVVELIRIDDNGNQDGGVLAAASTDADGMFAIETDLELSVDLLLKVDLVGGALMRAFVTGTNTDVNPVSEYVVREVLAAISANSSVTPELFADAEIEGMIDAVNNRNLDLSAEVTLAGALASIDAAVGSEIDGLIASAIDPTSVRVSVKVFLGDPGAAITSTPMNDTDRRARVTLVHGGGTRVRDTNASGVATFDGVTSGPLTVTGQYDYTSPGAERIRAATTLHDIVPVQGEVGLIIETDYNDAEEIPPIVNTTISGTVNNIPTIPAGHNFIVSIIPIDACCSGGITVVVPGGQTSIDYVVSNANLLGNRNLGNGDYLVYAEVSAFSNPPTFTRSLVTVSVHPNVVSVTGGLDTADVDIDFADGSHTMDFADKTVTFNNYTVADGHGLDITNLIYFPGLGEFTINAFTNGSASGEEPFVLPATVSMIASAPSAATVTYLFDLDAQPADKDVEVAFANMNSVTFDVPVALAFTWPTAFQMFDSSDAASMTIAWTDTNAVAPSVYQLLLVDMAGRNAGLSGIDGTFWQHFVPPGSVSVELPVTALPMFGPDASYLIALAHQRVEGFPGFGEFFGFDIDQNFIEAVSPPGIQASTGISLPVSTLPLNNR